jgi:hypothetical protein
MAIMISCSSLVVAYMYVLVRTEEANFRSILLPQSPKNPFGTKPGTAAGAPEPSPVATP